MKKFLTFLFLAVTAMTFVSCDDDKIANSLDGIWTGRVDMEYFNYRSKGGSFFVEIQFYADPSQYAKGTGIERDYSERGVCTSVNNFDFEVRNERIYLHYDDGTDVVIRNYELVDNHFHGFFLNYNTGEVLAEFNLYRVENWRYSGYSGYTANPDSTATFEEVKDTIK